MAISVVGVSTQVASTSGNLTLTEPADTQPGDVLIAMIGFRDTAPFVKPDNNWSLAAEELTGNTSATNTTAIASGAMFIAVRGQSAPSYTFTRTGGSVAIGSVMTLRGVDLSGDFGTIHATSPAATTTTTTTSGFTTTVKNTFLVMGLAGAVNAAFSNYRATQDPLNTDWTEQLDRNFGTSPTVAVAIATATKQDIGTTGQLRATCSTSTTNAIICVSLSPIITPGGSGIILNRRRR